MRGVRGANREMPWKGRRALKQDRRQQGTRQQKGQGKTRSLLCAGASFMLVRTVPGCMHPHQHTHTAPWLFCFACFVLDPGEVCSDGGRKARRTRPPIQGLRTCFVYLAGLCSVPTPWHHTRTLDLARARTGKGSRGERRGLGGQKGHVEEKEASPPSKGPSIRA